MTSIEILTGVSRSFRNRCIIGIEPNKTRVREHLDKCLMLVTALNPDIGHEKAAKMTSPLRGAR